jgi:hypothetical protein
MLGGAISPPPPDYLEILGEWISRGNDKIGGGCILLLGPGAAIHPTDPKHPSLTTSLARQLADDLKISQTFNMRDNLRYVAQVYTHERTRDRLALSVRHFYEGFRGKTTSFHRNLAHLPFRLCICTSPDDYMSSAFREAGKKPHTAHYHFKHFRDLGKDVKATENTPLVYYLYGNTDELESLVLTEEDLIEFLVSVVKGNPGLPDLIKAWLGDEESTFLFLGFGFRNWYLRVLLHVLNIYGHGHRAHAMAVEDESFFGNREECQETVGYFSGEHAFEFRQVPWEDFATDLLKAYRRAAPSPPPPAPEPPPGAPKAFLSYVREDGQAVADLREKLKKHGIAIWQDVNDELPGDRWERVITDVIKHKADYFIVAQSRQMIGRIQTEVQKEIELALARQSLILDNKFRFVIPVTLDDCKPLMELSHLHHIRVDTEAGVDRLAESILEDWKEHAEVQAKALPVVAKTGSP